MDFRPDYYLDRLCMMTSLETDPSTENEATGSLTAAVSGNNGPRLHLRWLRTIVVDLCFTEKKIASTEKFALLQRSVCNGAVERILAKELGNEHVPYLELLVKSLFGVVDGLSLCSTRLTCLDLRGCDNRHPAWHSFWSMMTAEEGSGRRSASSIASSLRRLYLPRVANVTQATLNHFVQLEELDATCCTSLTTVDFCCKTLRVLYANFCTNLTNEGLKNATCLKVLHVSCGSRALSLVRPFQHCLVELDCSGDCGIDSAALSDCYRLQVLRVVDNEKITTLMPFAERLRELAADGWNNKLDDAALVPATGLVQLSIDRNEYITTVAPFAASLRDLCASGCRLDDHGLTDAVNLVRLSALENVAIRSLAPFASSLLELDATASGVNDTTLSAATQLVSLSLMNGNELISTLHGNRLLKHLAANESVLTDEGLSHVTQLITFKAWAVPKVTTLSPFRDCLQELYTDHETSIAEVQLAPNVYRVFASYMWSNAVPQAVLPPLGFQPLVMESRHSEWHRETATHHYPPPERTF